MRDAFGGARESWFSERCTGKIERGQDFNGTMHFERMKWIPARSCVLNDIR
jgi:hypothetical protein